MTRAAVLIIWNLALTILLLLSLEIGVRYFYRDEPYRRTSPGLHQSAKAVWVDPDHDLGWTVTRSREFRTLEQVPYQINRQGFRSDRDFTAKEEGGSRRAVVLGDSFTFGAHLPETEAFPHMLNQFLGAGWDVVNMGVPGYGIDQMVLAYEKYGDVLQPKVVLLVFIAEDIERVFEAFRRAEGLSKPSFDLYFGQLRPRRPGGGSVFDSFLDSSRVANVIYFDWYRPWQSRRISRAFVRRLAASVAAQHAQLIVAQYPMLDQERRRLTHVTGVFERDLIDTGMTYIDLIRVFDGKGDPARFFLADGHPNGMANDLVARALVSDWPR
jgi:hypothetical protein